MKIAKYRKENNKIKTFISQEKYNIIKNFISVESL